MFFTSSFPPTPTLHIKKTTTTLKRYKFCPGPGKAESFLLRICAVDIQAVAENSLEFLALRSLSLES